MKPLQVFYENDLSATDCKAVRSAVAAFAERGGRLAQIGPRTDEGWLDAGRFVVLLRLNINKRAIVVVAIERREGAHGASQGFLDDSALPEETE